MPKSDPTPKALRPYAHHGVNFAYPSNDEAVSQCPFCDKHKFYAGCGDGMFKCHVCGVEGNVVTFLEEVHRRSMSTTTDYGWIEKHRKLPASAMRRWGVCQSILTGEWLVPGYGVSGRINNLYRYVKAEGYSLQGTWECPVTVFHATGQPPDHERVLTAEGVWDGIALWDRLRKVKPAGGPYSVVAVPGVTAIPPKWCEALSGKHVTLLFDNDHPRERGGRVIRPGYDGTKWTTGALCTQEEPPKSISYLFWGDEGYDKGHPDGCDVRDLLAEEGNEPLTALLGRVRPVPGEWTEGKSTKRGSGTAEQLTAEKCESYSVLREACADAFMWTPGHDGGMIVVLASIASVKGQGEQLWLKLVSPPSGGKTTICEAVAAARKYVVSESTMNGFYSGHKTDAEGTEDHSLAARLFDKTLVTKDGDTILASDFKDTILSQARDLYDGAARKSYNNAVRREYQGLRFTWILAGTSSLRRLDQSELGQRFLDYVMMDRIDDDLEDEIIRNAVLTAARNAKVMSNCKMETTMDAKYVRMVRLTAGYVEYLKRASEQLVGDLTFPQESLSECGRLAKFVAYMRARPSVQQEESSDRELGTRLAKQLVKLAQYVAVVLNRSSVDYPVMGIVRKVAMDTARGRTLEIVRAIAGSGSVGMDLRDVARETKQLTHKEGSYMQFLTNIEALEQFDDGLPTLSRTARWRLTGPFERLYRSVVGNTNKVGV